MAWRFVLTDSLGANYSSLGEVLNAFERKLSLPLNGLPTASFQIRLDNPLATEITDRDGDVLLKVYGPDSTLRFIGDLTNAEEVGGDQGQTLACNFAGPLWRLQKRLIGKHVQGRGFTETDAAQILRSLLDEANAEQGASPGSDTGIREGTLDVLYNTSAGIEQPWRFKPIAEAYTEMQASKVPFPVTTPPAYSARDDFTQAGNPALHGATATDTTAWDTNDTGPTDYDIVSASDYCHRFAAGDTTFATGKWAVSGTGNHGAVVVGVDYELGAPLTYSGSDAVYSGVFARYADQNNWLLAVLDLASNSIILRKKVAGAGHTTTFGSFTFSGGGVVHSTRYAIRLFVDDAGNFAVYHWAVGDPLAPGAPVISGTHPDLASTGALNTGRVGFYDAMTTGVADDRNYYNFWAADYTGPQSFDFEIAPVEPVADTYTIDLGPGPIMYSGVKLANLNVRYRIGTDKPNVIFEYGGGNRSVKSYRRAINRDGLLTQSYSLPSNFPEDTDILGADDPTAIAARGRYEEVVVTDAQDDGLRQAFAIYNVRVRKQAQQIVAFEPSSTAPVFGTDYIVGDAVTARAIVNGSVRFNGLVKVYQVDVSIDENGREDVVPTLVQESS